MADKEDKSKNDEINMMAMWELLFDKNKKGEKNMVLEKLLNKKIKIWSVLSTTVGGVRGTWKGTTGVLTSFDDEFIVLDEIYVLSRKFIYRIECI